MNVISLYSIKWITKATASNFQRGLGAIPTGVVITFIFFAPAALICVELAATYPSDGGLYECLKKAFGEGKVLWFHD